MAIYEMYCRKTLRPGTVLLGIDPWVFNPNRKQNKWHSVADDYSACCQRLGRQEPPVEQGCLLWRADELFSPSYFQVSVKDLVRTVTGNRETLNGYYPTSETQGDVFIKLCDGSLSYDRGYETRSSAQVQQEALAYAAHPPDDYFASFMDFDPDATGRLEALIDLIKQDGAQVIFYLPPFHPRVYHTFATSRSYGMVIRVEEYLGQLARRKGIPVVGSYNPDVVGCDDRDFLAAHHIRGESLIKLFRSDKLRVMVAGYPLQTQ